MRRAFTLLEILISVVVLAIGLVGVVAIFPAVIDLQRRAQDTVVGTAAASSAEAKLVGTFIENDSLDWLDDAEWRDVFDSGTYSRADFFPVFDILRLDQNISIQDARVPVGGTSAVYDFLWDAQWEWGRSQNQNASATLEQTGDLVIGGGISYPVPFGPSQNRVNLNLPVYEIDLGQRLLPDAASGQDPRYVYDMVVRRVDAGIGFVPRGNRRTYEKRIETDRLGELPLQFAVFVRRIDRNIRTPQGVSIREAITGVRDEIGNDDPIRNEDRRLPLAVRRDNLAQIVNNGKPGDHFYSRPVAGLLRNITLLESKANSGVFDQFDPLSLRFQGSSVGADAAAAALAQVGQRFVDNTGVVREVIAIDTRTVDGREREVLRIDPPFASNSLDDYRQIVFTPQIPVDIRVLTTR